MNELKQKLRQFAKARDWEQFHSPKNLAMALSVEVAEIMEHFQWLTQEESKNLTGEKLEQIRHELGDILIFLVRLSDTLGIDPIIAANDKIKINEKKYPADTVRGSAKKYSEYE